MERLNNFRKAFIRFWLSCISCICETESMDQDRGSFYRPIHGGHFTVRVVEYRQPVRHRYAPCSPRYSGPETLENICKAIEALEKLDDKNENPADGDGNNRQAVSS